MTMPWHVEEQAVELLLQGMSSREVGRMIGVNEITLRRLIARRSELQHLPQQRRLLESMAADAKLMLAAAASEDGAAAVVERMMASAGDG